MALPSDDLVLNVRQIAQYPVPATVDPFSLILIQPGLGAPYQAPTVEQLVGTALAQTGNLFVGGSTTLADLHAQCGHINSLGANLLCASSAEIGSADFTAATIAKLPIATQAYVDGSIASFEAAGIVTSFDGRTGNIVLNLSDVTAAGAAPINSPIFGGNPMANTPPLNDSSNRLATTEFTWGAIDSAIDAVLQTNLVTTFNGRGGDVILSTADIIGAGGAPQDTPVFIGNPQAPTPAQGDNSASIATTAFVDAAIAGQTAWAPLNSPVFTGVPTAPTAAPGANTGQLATTAFVQAAVTASTSGVSSFNLRTGAVVLTSADITSAGGALLASPIFTGTPSSTTPAPGDNSTKIATTAFVDAALANASIGVMTFNGRAGVVTLTSADITGAGGALLAGPTFTGVPSGPTATAGTNTTQLATCAFVMGQLAAGAVSSFNARTGAVTLNVNDISAAGGAVLASPAFTGTPTAPTPASSDSSQTIATTAFVHNVIASATVVASFNGRTGAVVLTQSDVTGVGAALTASPSFSGTPTAPTATAGTSNTQIATTAFVTAGFAPVNNPTFLGTVTIPAGASIAGFAPIASPVLTGIPAAPTASPGTNTTQLATTAFVMAQLAAGAVSSFNSRTGAVTLNVNDITAANGAPINSPTFTGTPAAPTAVAGTNTTQIATTAFVTGALASAVAGVSSFNTRTGAVVLSTADITGAGGAQIASPAFTGTPTSTTPAPADNSTNIATTAYVKSQGYAPINSPTFTGTPTSTTPAPADNSTNIATTAFAQPRVGVTNGSNAAAGQVGEYITSSLQSGNISANVATSLAVITLTAGDWDLGGFASYGPSAASANFLLGYGSDGSSFDTTIGPYLSWGSSINPSYGLYVPLQATRLNMTTNKTVYLMVQGVVAGNVTGRIWARRMR